MLTNEEAKKLVKMSKPIVARISVSSGFASVMAVNEWLEWQAHLNDEERQFCQGYMHGYSDGRAAGDGYNGPG